jgi:hypothetical protein
MQNCPKKIWTEVVNYACFNTNRILYAAIDFKVSKEVWINKLVDN